MKEKDYVDPETKRAVVMKWLESMPPESYPEIAQRMWPDIDPNTALSLFLKKLRNVKRNS